MAEVNRATRDYVRRLLLAMAVYVAVLLAVVAVNGAFSVGAWRYVLFLLPVIPLVFAAWAVLRLISDVDELQRRIQLEGLAIAFGAGSLITTAYGLLQVVGLPQVSWLFVMPVYAGCWAIGSLLAHRRYA